MNQMHIMQCCKKVLNVRGLQLKCARVLYEELLMHVFMHGTETMIWKEKGCTE